MKLSTRFYLLMTAIFLGFSLLAWLVFSDMVRDINQRWGEQFAERQVLFDKHRTLAPLIREIRLARQMAADPALIEMALHEDDASARRRGIKTMEGYRFHFQDHSYFAAFAHSGHYYFNDADGQYSGRQLRYTLSPTEQNDKWFYATLNDGKDYQINLDPDVHLGVVKVWINVLLKNKGEVLGVIGTGINLTDFLKESVGIAQPNVHNFFVDKSLAIQLSTDTSLIDYASLAKDVSERIRVDKLFPKAQDIGRLNAVVAELERHPNEVKTIWVEFKGERHLLGIAYLPEIGWYDLTLMDQHALALSHDNLWLPLTIAVLLLLALVILGVLLHRWVLRPIYRLKVATEKIQHGNYDIDPPKPGPGELGMLARSFWLMVLFVRQTKDDLESKIRERTEDLHRLTEIDPLTGLLNRRGMTDRFENEIARQARQGGSIGILLLDLDHFKQVNDTYGHAAGDLALCATANVLRSMKRSYDHAGRWGGEEFLLLLPECSEADLLSIAERIREVIEGLRIEAGAQTFSFTISIGAHLPQAPQTLDGMLQQVDKALYAAKDAGRNCVRLAQAL